MNVEGAEILVSVGTALAVGMLSLVLGYLVFIRPYFQKRREYFKRLEYFNKLEWKRKRKQYLEASEKERVLQRKAYAEGWDGLGHPASYLADLEVQASEWINCK